jgi:replicative DNA helicase
MSHNFEEAVLSAALVDAASWHTVVTQLSARDFADEDHRHIFAALSTVPPTDDRVDVIAVGAALTRAKHDGLRDRLGELIDVVVTVAPLPSWITALRETTQQRRALDAIRTAGLALKGGAPFADVDRTLDAALSAIRASAPDARVFDDKGQMVASALEYLLDDSRSGTPYGFATWDAAVLPAMTGHLVLYGGASGAGKSLVGRNTLRQWVKRSSARTGWLTCEMTGEEQLVHLACIDAELTIEDYYRRKLTTEQAREFKRSLEFWRDSDLLKVNELAAVTPEIALRIFRRWREQGVTHFVLDHLHRLDYGAKKSGDDLRVPVAAFARSLKTFAKDSQATVLALVQYSKIKDHDEPSDDKIREANNILEEADAVFHVYRPLVQVEADTKGEMHPVAKPGSVLPVFEHEAPKGATLGHDATAVYIKLGKQRRRLREGLIRVPFNHRLGVMYDTLRPDIRRMAG